MSDSQPVVEQGDKGAQSSLGKILREGREKKGLSQNDVALQLCLRQRSIEALESDVIEQGISPTYVKGYVKLYAKLLALEPEPLLEEFDKLHEPATKQTSLQSFSRRVSREANDSRWNIVTYVIAFLVIGSVVLWWFEQSDFSIRNIEFVPIEPGSKVEDVQDLDEVQGAFENGSQITQDESTALNEQYPIDDDSTLVELEQPQDIVPAQTTDSTAQEPTENISHVNKQEDGEGTSENSTRIVPEPASESNSNDDEVVEMVFTFSDDCWVSVKDALGDTIAIGTKVKGRVMSISGVAPISVVLGAPHVVSINVNGTAVDLSIYPEGSAASFQIPK